MAHNLTSFSAITKKLPCAMDQCRLRWCHCKIRPERARRGIRDIQHGIVAAQAHATYLPRSAVAAVGRPKLGGAVLSGFGEKLVRLLKCTPKSSAVGVHIQARTPAWRGIALHTTSRILLLLERDRETGYERTLVEPIHSHPGGGAAREKRAQSARGTSAKSVRVGIATPE